jgi:hypothetical protein
VVHAARGFADGALAPVAVHFRRLGEAEIEHYLRTEQPYDCAGSAKCETLGIALLDAIESDDPTALVGLPLIRTCRLLRAGRARSAPPMSGRLLLVPNTLDFGVHRRGPRAARRGAAAGGDRTAASLRCWVAENAKTTRRS